ncbi:unnamed protein product [Ilex paraguariensis]|uniref:SHSP domain-containing protein n=1 Tax=Ilex paraguariensis TaxID=185542 RepID=A0ABC8S513_9AQUA
MIRSVPYCRPNLIKILILLTPIIFGFFATTALQIETMKVHPVSMKRNITVRDDFDSWSQTLTLMEGSAQKKLKRLPHVFNKVLELPFRSDADVTVEETSEFFRFVAEIDDEDAVGVGDEVRAHAVEIHPGVTKIVVRSGGVGDGVIEELLDNLKVDTWRFRLPATTRTELAQAVFVDGELIVTVPKGGEEEGGSEGWAALSRLLVVQQSCF